MYNLKNVIKKVSVYPIFKTSILLISTAIFWYACSKPAPLDPIQEPEPEEEPGIDLENTITQDITDLASIKVSHENPDGKEGQEGSSKLTDKDTTTKFLVRDFSELNVDFEYDSARLVASYEIVSGNDADGRDPMDWKLLGSNDGTNWTQLDAHWGEQFRSRRLTRRFYFKNQTPYKYYRWSVTKLYYADMFQASEFKLYQMPPSEQKYTPVSRIDTIIQNGLTLLFVNNSVKESLSYQNVLTNAFLTVYPRLMADFNPNAKKKVYFIIDPSYKGVAYKIGDVVVFSYDFMESNPNEGDVAVHEIMHHIQEYPNGAPGWLSEGIADYVRYKYGLDENTSWALPDFSRDHKYTDAYRVTARFLVWIEKHEMENFVQNVNQSLIEGTYTEEYWQQTFGMSIDELWEKYAQNPAL